MTRWIVDLQKRDSFTRQTWGNRYIIEAGSINDAKEAGFVLRDAEVAFHFDRVEFKSMRVSSQTEFDTDFIVIPLTEEGGQIVTDKVLPIFCTVDVFLTSGAGGRHGLKFYHTLFDALNYDADGTIDDTYKTAVASALTDAIVMLGDIPASLVSPTGAHTYTDVAVQNDVGSHQFTKASKRAPAS
jgi:hypothetical protein